LHRPPPSTLFPYTTLFRSLQYTSFTVASTADYLQLVVGGAGGGTNASDSRTVQVVAPTLASAANQVFVVGQAAAAMATITVTDADRKSTRLNSSHVSISYA